MMLLEGDEINIMEDADGPFEAYVVSRRIWRRDGDTLRVMVQRCVTTRTFVVV